MVESGLLATQFDPKDDYLILTADTIVYHQGAVLGKPVDEAEAFQTLRRLSGNRHQVITAFCLWNTQADRKVTGHCTSEVEFRELKDDEIWHYVRSGDPMDKAGSYGIQSLAREFIQSQAHRIQSAAEEQLGSTFRTEGRDFVTTFTGALENIAGLPIDEIEAVAHREGWPFPKK